MAGQIIYHKHLLVNAKITKPMTSPEEGINFLTQLVNKIGMKILQGPFATYVDVPGNRGLTGIVLIETSHIAFHMWDEQDPALLQFDLYTCGTLEYKNVLNAIQQKFQPTEMEYLLLDREKGFDIQVKNQTQN